VQLNQIREFKVQSNGSIMEMIILLSSPVRVGLVSHADSVVLPLSSVSENTIHEFGGAVMAQVHRVLNKRVTTVS